MSKTIFDTGITHYSEEVKGDKGNYDWKVKFDKTMPEGYIGITQITDRGTERVLLSPLQAKELMKFIRTKHPNHL